MEEETGVQSNYSPAARLKPWQFKPGQSGNPSGKPKGTVSLKVWAKKYIQELDDQGKLDFIAGLDKIDIWKMSEGNPNTKNEHTGNLTIAQILKEIGDEGTSRPTVENPEPVQDTGQTEESVKISAQQSSAALREQPLVEKYNPEEPPTGI